MRIAGATVLTQNIAPPADAIQTLIDHHAVTRCEVLDSAAHLFDYTRDLMPEDLRLHRERNRLVVLIRVVICVTREDVNVGAAKSNPRRAHQHFIRRDYRTRNIANLESLYITQHAGFHRTAHVISLVSRWPASRSSANRIIVARMPSV